MRGIRRGEANFPGTLDELVTAGRPMLMEAGRTLARARVLEPGQITLLPPLSCVAKKIICVGLNYTDHAQEGGFELPPHPSLFARFASTLVAHGEPLIRPQVSDRFDYEGELVAVIGKAGRHIEEASALTHVAGYSIFNDASVRDYQMRTTQWMIGKNFDATGAFGPYFVSGDELPPGARELRLQTRLNGNVVQSASTSDMIFPVAALIRIISEAMTLQAGDIIVTGTPSGVGFARKPPLFMKPGDVCEIEIDGLGMLVNPIAAEGEGRIEPARQPR